MSWPVLLLMLSLSLLLLLLPLPRFLCFCAPFPLWSWPVVLVRCCPFWPLHTHPTTSCLRLWRAVCCAGCHHACKCGLNSARCVVAAALLCCDS